MNLNYSSTRKIGMILLFFLSLLAILTAGVYLFQNKFIFFPEVLHGNYQYDFEDNFEEVFYTANDGTKINALHFKSKKRTAGGPAI